MAQIAAHHIIYVDTLEVSRTAADRLLGAMKEIDVLKDRQYQGQIDSLTMATSKTAAKLAARAVLEFKQRKKRQYQDNYRATLGPSAERSARAQEAAKQAAQDLWEKDCKHQILIGAMALKVYQILLGTEHKESLPDSDQSLRLWIKDVAPAYARKGGRPRKSP